MKSTATVNALPSPNLRHLVVGVLCILLLVLRLGAAPREAPPTTASNPFLIPATPPDITITSDRMLIGSDVVTLEGNVRAIRSGDILTCHKAFMGENPRWILASRTPRLVRKESIPEKKLMREMTLDALNIRYDEASGTFNASPAVNLKIEERTWDLATYSWVIISADSMIGHQDDNHLSFNGNVRLKDKDHFGRGHHLDYFKNQATAYLTGDAMLETEEWNAKEKKMEKRILTGQKITYNTDTKEMQSE